MLAPVDFKRAIRIVVLGGGPGILTKKILKQLPPSGQLFVFETNPVFVARLQRIKDDRLHVVPVSAIYMSRHLYDFGLSMNRVDYVISTLPMVLMPDSSVLDITSQAHRILRKNGKFIQLHHTTLLKRLYGRIFGNVQVSFMPLTFPPAFIMACSKR